VLTLAARRELRSGGQVIERTPLLVPSFSSRLAQINKIFQACSEFIEGAYLISAYDVRRSLLSPPYDVGSLVFLDSGGYEVSKDTDLSDVSDRPPAPDDWREPEQAEFVSGWRPSIPSVIISFDHPNARQPIESQIAAAKKLPQGPNICREILVKPETKDQQFVPVVESLLPQVRALCDFDAVGITEKEIGNSVFERMINIARLRLALQKVGLEIPIHLFGSLDSITTLYYFVAGADIFDGLAWLRYAFVDGLTIYRQNFGLLQLDISTKAPQVEAVCWCRNYHYIKNMQLEMRRFLKAADFAVFKHHGELLRAAYQNVEEELGG
jgi:hypothetical protein